MTAGTSIASSSSVLVSASTVATPVLAINLMSGESFGNQVTDNGQIQWIAQGTNTQPSTSVFSGSGNMRITAPGTTILLGTNTFSGGTTIDTTGEVLAGNPNTNTSSAFGSGVLTIHNGYVDTYQSQLLAIQTGGYVQTGGEIGIHVEGTTPGSYTRYNVTGTATLSGGTVYLYDQSGIYVPQGAWSGNPSGDIQNIIHTTGGLSGSLASNTPYARIYNAAFNQDFLYHQGDTLLHPTVTYNAANANITGVQDSFQSPSGLTPNQSAIGGALDIYQNRNQSTAGGVVTYLNGQNIASLSSMYDLIAPDELTALFQIGFSNAEIQNTNIERHLEQVRASAGTAAPTTTTSRVRDSKGGTVEQTTSTPDDKRWSIFMEGTGGSASVAGDRNANGYDFNTFGMTLGADYRVNDHFVIGILGAYADSEASLVNHGNIDIASYKGAVYATAFANGFYVDALLGAGYNSYDTTRASLLGDARGSSDGWELDSLVNVGYDIHQGAWTFSPMASVAYTRVSLNSFRESGSLTPLDYPNQDQQSLRTNLGMKIAYTAICNGMKITPQARLSWQHEFLDSTQSIDSQFAAGSSPMFTVSGPGMDRDRALLSAGVSVQFTPTLTGYAFYDGQLGSSSYNSNSVSVGVKLDF